MGKTTNRNKKLFIISIILLIIIILSCASLNIYLYNINEDLSKRKIKYSNNNNSSIEKLKSLNSQLEEIKEKTNKLENIEKDIAETKKQLFTNIKLLEDKILKSESNKKIAYLTFDDGPYYSTYEFLKVLKNNNVKATFFVIGQGKEKCFDNSSENCTKLYKEIAKGGHTIANHTYSHAIFYGLYASTSSFINEVNKMENKIKEETGVTPNIVRFPGGSATAGYNKTNIINELRKKNYGWVDWTAQDGDGGDGLHTSEQAMANLKSSVSDKIEVILFHDYSRITLSILNDAIKYLREQGYILLPLFYESNMVNK